MSFKLINKPISSVADNASSNTPWYVFAAISAAALVVVVAVIAALICFLQRRRRNRQGNNNQQAASGVGKEIKQNSASFNNQAYVS